MAKKRKTESAGYVPGDMGGRGPHPKFPNGFPPNHWPLPLPHEKADWKGWDRKESVDPAPKPQTPAAPIRSSTGLNTVEDFRNEATLLGVASKELFDKFDRAFAEAPNNGMKRMRCNNLLRGAVKRATPTT